MEFIDFAAGRRGPDLSLLFPGWQEGENVAFLSPHDDDAALGAGYLLRAVAERGGIPHVWVFCRGDAGYSTVAAKAGIVEVRRAETRRAYQLLGVPGENIASFDVPDFALLATLVREPGPLGSSLFDRLVARLRLHRVSRVVFSSGHLEHADHTAVFLHALYTAPQAGDPILADLGEPFAAKTWLAYSVWSDFGPLEDPARPAADKGILADGTTESRIRESLAAFASQSLIMSGTVSARREDRKVGGGRLELYRSYDIRTPVDFAAYRRRLAAMSGQGRKP
jgi:LmbE family N-acetylglucosaminyl deacetylase